MRERTRRSLGRLLAPLGLSLATLVVPASAEVERRLRDDRLLPEAPVDLSEAVIVASPTLSNRTEILRFLQEEIEARSGIHLRIAESVPPDGVTPIILGTVDRLPGGSPALPPDLEPPHRPEGYAIWVETESRAAPTLSLLGHDDRGALFAAGRLIRLLHLEPGRVSIESGTALASTPEYPLRGHMIGAGQHEWTLATYERLIRDLVMFGTNSFEIIPTLDERRWPLYVELSERLEAYGLDLWLFLPRSVPEDEADWTDDEERESLVSRRRLLQRLEGVDAIFIPGGDASNTPRSEVLLPWVEKFAPVVEDASPGTAIWMSNQCYGGPHAHESNDYIFTKLRTERPEWLRGMVYGPWTRMSIAELRKRTPDRYRLRHYPDICHNRWCQYPVPRWDHAFARVQGRNAICPRPRQMARVHNLYAPHTDGFIAYNHTGHRNDLNKFVWSAMGWDTGTDLETLLREYGAVFFGEAYARDVARGLLMLEANWDGPALENPTIEDTLRHWQRLARRGGEELAGNPRFQMYLTRAYLDAYVQRKKELEVRLEAEAHQALGRARMVGVREAIGSARQVLAGVETAFPTLAELREVFRGEGLDAFEGELEPLYSSLNDRQWLEAELDSVLRMDDRENQLAHLATLASWEDPGPGGQYDNLGVPGQQPHLVRQESYWQDPGFVDSPIEFHAQKPDSPYRQSWLTWATTRYETPLLMHYEGLDPEAEYRLRVTYAGGFRPVMKLFADERFEVHGPLAPPDTMWPVELAVPRKATEDGVLDLRWELVNVVRGCQVAEVWLIRTPGSTSAPLP